MNAKIDYDLIQSCYENDFGIDLRNYHKQICNIAHNEQDLLDNILDNDRVVFQDGVSQYFRLQIYNNLVYLIGDKSCYLCSNVVNSAYGSELNWVSCIVNPSHGNIVNGETDIRKSGVIVSLFSDLIPHISDATRFYSFIKGLEFTFQDCDWFKRIHSLLLYIKLVKFWDYKEKITNLFQFGLLYPTEFVLYAIYNNRELKNNQTLDFFVDSLAESTSKIFHKEEIRSFFSNLSAEEIEEILAVDFVRENINIDFLCDESFADLLEIDGTERYGMFVNDVYYIYHMRNQASLIFKRTEFKKDYIKVLGKNFRCLENRMRKGKGFDKVGSFYTEKLLVERLKLNFPNLTFLTQYSPKWLSPQRLDVFIKECNIAVEYHGAQHFIPIDFFGGMDGLKLRQHLDSIKKAKCSKNHIELIEISYDEDFEFAINKLFERIEYVSNISH